MEHFIKSGIVDNYAKAVGKKTFTGFHLERWLKKTLVRYNIPFFDECCDVNSTSPSTLRFNPAGAGTIERFNGTTWVTASAGTGNGSFTASRALISNPSGAISVSPTTTTELGYISGVTSAIQTQLNSKMTVVAVPGSATATGTVGQVAYDATYMYICTAPNTWRRIAHSTF